MKIKLINIAALLMLTSCTFSVNQIHTQGQATDTLDETQTSQPTVTPTVNIPLSAI